MRKLVIALCLLAFTGCAGSTKYGQCIGLADEEDPALQYKVSKRNAVMSILFVETFVVPVLWVISYAKCPYRLKVQK